MTEAFEIGVSLAFSDGVADQMVIAKRGAADLEAVLSSGGISIEQLRRAASHAVASARMTPIDRQFEKVPSDVRAATTDVLPTGTSALPAKGPSTLDVVKPVAGPFQANTAPFPAMQTHLAGQQERFTERPAVPSRVVPSATAHSAVSEQARTSSGASPGGESIARMSVYGKASAAVAPAPATASETRSGAPVVTYTALSNLERRHEVIDSPTGNQNPWSSELPDLGSPIFKSAIMSSTGQPRAPSRASRVDQTMPATAPSMMSGGAQPQHTVPDKMGPPAANNDGRPREAENQQTAMQIRGDVFLDGALVGRWMSRQMNREAERASVGSTGFDASRGRLLPGPTVGGQ